MFIQYKFLKPLWKSIWRILKKLKITISYGPILSLLGIFQKDHAFYLGDTCSAMFVAFQYLIVWKWTQLRLTLRG